MKVTRHHRSYSASQGLTKFWRHCSDRLSCGTKTSETAGRSLCWERSRRCCCWCFGWTQWWCDGCRLAVSVFVWCARREQYGELWSRNSYSCACAIDRVDEGSCVAAWCLVPLRRWCISLHPSFQSLIFRRIIRLFLLTREPATGKSGRSSVEMQLFSTTQDRLPIWTVVISP